MTDRLRSLPNNAKFVLYRLHRTKDLLIGLKNSGFVDPKTSVHDLVDKTDSNLLCPPEDILRDYISNIAWTIADINRETGVAIDHVDRTLISAILGSLNLKDQKKWSQFIS